MIGAIFVKFSQLILMKIIKVVAIRCHVLRLNYTKFNFGWASPETLLGELTALLQTHLLDLRGLFLRGGERKKGNASMGIRMGMSKRKPTLCPI